MNKIFIYLYLLLFVSTGYSKGINLVEPINNYKSPSYSVTFSWNPITSNSGYIIKVALDPNFNTIINTFGVNQTSKQITFSPTTTTIYWKVTTDKTNGFAESDIYTLNFINPSKDPNLLVWLAADSNIVMNPDSTVSAWNNIIPNGFNALQPDLNRQPKLASKIQLLNNKNVIRMDGLNDNFTIDGGGIVGSCYTIFNYNGAVFPDYSALLTTKIFFTPDGFDNYIITAAPPNTTFYEPSGYFGGNGTRGHVFVNTTPLMSPYSLSPLSTYKLFAGLRDVSSPKNKADFSIGAETNSNRFWKGDVSEMIISKTYSLTEADSIQTYLLNKYAPPITMKDVVVGNNFCSSAAIVAPNNYVNYIWSNGATTSSINATSGTYSIKVKDVFGRESSTSFNAFPYVKLNNINITICQGDTFKLDLKTPPGFTANWNTGATTTAINITQPGRYTVTITDNAGCTVNDTVNVFIDNPTLSKPIVGGIITACLNEKLIVNSATSIDSIFWSSGNNTPIFIATTDGNYNVYAQTSAGCVLNQAFTLNIVGEAPTADFIVNSSLCQGANISFLDISAVPIGNTVASRNWNFSNGTSSNNNNSNPSTIFNNFGTISASLKVITNRGCSDSTFKTFSVNKRPKAEFETRLSCSGNPTQFVDYSRLAVPI